MLPKKLCNNKSSLIVILVLLFNGASSAQDQSGYSPIFSPATEGEVLEFSLQNEKGETIPTKTYFDPDNQILSVQVPGNADQTALVPEFEVTTGFAIEPESGVTQDFSDTVFYTLRSETTEQSFKWQVNVFDPESGMIFSGEDFKAWQLMEKNFDGKVDNSKGLYFKNSADAPKGSWALFYYENPKPVVRMEWKSERNEHHGKLTDQVLDLAMIPSDDFAESKWPEGGISDTEKLVRWSSSPRGFHGKRLSRVDLSAAPVEGPVALRYIRTGGAGKAYWMEVKKIMLTFADE